MWLKARYVVPVESPPIENGAVLVENGRIAAVGPSREVASGDGYDFADAVILPGLVNAHTHLDLSLLAGRVPPTPDFPHWLRRLVDACRATSATFEQVREAVALGIRQSLQAGVTTIGDITASPAWTREVLAEAPLRAVSYGEVIAIGTLRGQLTSRLHAAADTSHASDRLRIGISPHAPYTVEPDGLRTCAEVAAQHQLPLCIHLGETREEAQFTREASGPLADHLRALGIWDDAIPASGCGPVELAGRLGLLTPATLLAHVNYLTGADIDRIAKCRSSVVFCPRTHHAFGHDPHRFRDMLRAGINVCIGTDSLASNPSLSVFDELRFLRRHAADVPASTLLEMGTIRGARALGCDGETGSLAPAKWADVAVIPLEAAAASTGWESILEGTSSPLAVYVNGHPPPGLPPLD